VTWFQDPTDHPSLKNTPLGRAHYPKQMKFFGLEKTDDETALFGGNRCLTPWTVIPTDRGERQVHEVCGAESFGVQTWADGSLQSAESTGVFLKCIEPAFRVHLDNGEVFECTGKHRVLIHEVMDGRRRETWQTLDQIVQRANGRHWTRTVEGWRPSYDTGNYLDGSRLLYRLDSDQTILRILGDARSSIPYGSHSDEAGRTHTRNRVCRVFDRRPIADVRFQTSDLDGISQWEAPSLPPSALPKFPKEMCDGRSPEYRRRSAEEWQQSILLTLQSSGLNDVWLPLEDTPLVGGNSIVAVVGLGLQPIVDFEVPGTHCYVAAGAVHHNTGKTHCGCYADTLHLTGLYPDWWPGRRFTHPIDMWVATDTAKNTRDILQEKFCGKPGQEQALGTGMIPGDLIVRRTVKHGLADAFESVFVRHVSGGVSTLQFKSYDQGRESFQGTRQHRIHLDEEPKLEIYTECLLRLMSTVPGEANGTLVLTETPMLGVSDLMITFMPDLSPEPDAAPTEAWDLGEEETVIDESCSDIS
jgi:phage terminase large subunit-like protein